MSIQYNPRFQRVQVSKEIYIQYDLEDTWLSIIDENWHEYDLGSGGVTLAFADIDKVTEELERFKQVITGASRNNQKLVPTAEEKGIPVEILNKLWGTSLGEARKQGRPSHVYVIFGRMVEEWLIEAEAYAQYAKDEIENEL